ncbi:hypothetical protein NE237_033219 [Protea cynaroides]|uniref:Uncharacterized protein n=1 Tax=Protea cynaroides TaxID=273540 RepID=A0A9Q0L4U8_9MAGN|nr:hypothetical protein NE237_033219 [Protea cynaroides]
MYHKADVIPTVMAETLRGLDLVINNPHSCWTDFAGIPHLLQGCSLDEAYSFDLGISASEAKHLQYNRFLQELWNPICNRYILPQTQEAKANDGLDHQFKHQWRCGSVTTAVRLVKLESLASHERSSSSNFPCEILQIMEADLPGAFGAAIVDLAAIAKDKGHLIVEAELMRDEGAVGRVEFVNIS